MPETNVQLVSAWKRTQLIRASWYGYGKLSEDFWKSSEKQFRNFEKLGGMSNDGNSSEIKYRDFQKRTCENSSLILKFHILCQTVSLYGFMPV